MSFCLLVKVYSFFGRTSAFCALNFPLLAELCWTPILIDKFSWLNSPTRTMLIKFSVELCWTMLIKFSGCWLKSPDFLVWSPEFQRAKLGASWGISLQLPSWKIFFSPGISVVSPKRKRTGSNWAWPKKKGSKLCEIKDNARGCRPGYYETK